MASHPIYQFYAELEGFEPKIWRRFQITNQVTVSRFSYVVMIMYEMMASHLYSIEIDKAESIKTRIGETDSDYLNDPFWHNLKYMCIQPTLFDLNMSPFDSKVNVLDATQTKLNHFITDIGETMFLNYDFGDDWKVKLVLEAVFEDKKTLGSAFPNVLDGQGYGIIEDCGGVGGLYKMVTAYKKKKGQSYEDFVAWTGLESFDITAVNLDDMNFRIKKLPIVYKYIYEDNKPLTKRSMALLERNYEFLK